MNPQENFDLFDFEAKVIRANAFEYLVSGGIDTKRLGEVDRVLAELSTSKTGTEENKSVKVS